MVEHIWAEHGEDTEIPSTGHVARCLQAERETGLIEDPERRSRFHVWDGECHVHAGIRPDDIARTRAEHPGAEFLIHPNAAARPGDGVRGDR